MMKQKTKMRIEHNFLVTTTPQSNALQRNELKRNHAENNYLHNEYSMSVTFSIINLIFADQQRKKTTPTS